MLNFETVDLPSTNRQLLLRQWLPMRRLSKQLIERQKVLWKYKTNEKKNAVADRNMIFYYMVGITSFYKELTCLIKNNDVLKTHHEFDPFNKSASE